MVNINLVNVFLKIRDMSDITSEELIKALDGLEIDPQFYISKILFEFHYGLVDVDDISNESRLNYYRSVVNKFIEIYPDLYSYDDIELYSKFALVNYLYNIDSKKYIELDILNEILDLLEGDIEYKSLKWFIREMTKYYILRYYMYHKSYHHLMRPLVDELLVTENDFINLLESIS